MVSEPVGRAYWDPYAADYAEHIVLARRHC
jgi:hypothetical protein